jgi:hypothetical protein
MNKYNNPSFATMFYINLFYHFINKAYFLYKNKFSDSMAFLNCSGSCLWAFSRSLQLLWYKSEQDNVVLCFIKHHAMKTRGHGYLAAPQILDLSTRLKHTLIFMLWLFYSRHLFNRRVGEIRASLYSVEKNPYPWQEANLDSSVIQPTVQSPYWAIPAPQSVLHLMVCLI